MLGKKAGQILGRARLPVLQEDRKVSFSRTVRGGGASTTAWLNAVATLGHPNDGSFVEADGGGGAEGLKKRQGGWCECTFLSKVESKPKPHKKRNK